jgi:signal transduction histidine kinase
VQIYEWVVSCTFGILMVLVVNSADGFSDVPAILVFTAAATIADSMRIRPWPEMSFSLSAPVVLGAAFVLLPVEAGLVAFLAAADPREWRAEVPVGRALFNRSQVGMSVLIASAVFHALVGSSAGTTALIGAAVVALLVDVLANTLLVLFPATKVNLASPGQVLQAMYGPNYLVSGARFVCVGAMAPLIAITWQSAGVLGLVVFLMPVSLAWLVLRQGSELRETAITLEAQNRALAQGLDEIAAERRDERLTLAGELHDEVLPAIFNVHLMANVIKQDLAEGRLLQLEEDVLRILESAAAAQEAVRLTIGRTRASAIGGSGLSGAIRSSAERLEVATGIPFMLHLDEVDGPDRTMLVAYLVAREAMSNAVKHSGASMVVVRLRRDGPHATLSVRDDGCGFDSTMRKENHFGLPMMSERARAVGGSLSIDSVPGEGTTVSLALNRIGGLAGSRYEEPPA